MGHDGTRSARHFAGIGRADRLYFDRLAIDTLINRVLIGVFVVLAASVPVVAILTRSSPPHGVPAGVFSPQPASPGVAVRTVSRSKPKVAKPTPTTATTTTVTTTTTPAQSSTRVPITTPRTTPQTTPQATPQTTPRTTPHTAPPNTGPPDTGIEVPVTVAAVPTTVAGIQVPVTPTK